MMPRFITSLGLTALLCFPAAAQPAADVVQPIWPKSPPQWDAPAEQERDTTGEDGRMVAGRRVVRLGFVSVPELHVYRAKSGPGETAVLVCPGGGYNILAWNLEGTEIAQWLQGIGVTAVVVKYRVPTSRSDRNWLAPVQDMQSAISLVRSGAIEGVSPKRIGVLGFSARGNAAARTATAAQRFYDPIDDRDLAKCNADFAILVYPAWLVEKEDQSQLIEDLEVSETSPPMFFAHAYDDRVTCMSSVTLFSELRRHGVASALHIFSSGGHGFGARPSGQATDAWPALCQAWMEQQGWLE
jgi:endo-1,4-beta-xylanase